MQFPMLLRFKELKKNLGSLLIWPLIRFINNKRMNKIHVGIHKNLNILKNAPKPPIKHSRNQEEAPCPTYMRTGTRIIISLEILR